MSSQIQDAPITTTVMFIALCIIAGKAIQREQHDRKN
jgi:hypothetical protein